MENQLNKTIFESIPGFAEVCEKNGKTVEQFLSECERDNLPHDEACNRAIKMIKTALNPPDFKADFNNSNQEKWAPVFRGGAAGFGFRFSTYDCTVSCTCLGARHCFIDEDTSNKAGKTFTEIYKGVIIE